MMTLATRFEQLAKKLEEWIQAEEDQNKQQLEQAYELAACSGTDSCPETRDSLSLPSSNSQVD